MRYGLNEPHDVFEVHVLIRHVSDETSLLIFKSWFGAKDLIPAGLRSRVIYKFSCAGCSACYIGETKRHFATRIREHLASDKHSHIFKHLRGSENCRSLCSKDCFKILDSASTSFQFKIKEAMHILWEQPSLNSQVKHLNLSLSY